MTKTCVRMHTLHSDSITGTSTNTPTAAGESAPNSVMATATANSKKSLAPISAPGPQRCIPPGSTASAANSVPS